ncbi:hypothetical protein [Corynebacterium epidermidicanis]|uniref:hypothetical protein n=1 Tax=Corynebacterium epidermidicanis TaxID=1050174 RepID=UPI0011876DE7|nr:hypothetical protein [Corynebacterium epidermidicanis]
MPEDAPYYPSFLVVLTTFWMIYYCHIESGDPTGWLKYVAWRPRYLSEYVCSIALIVGASGMLTEVRKRHGRLRKD